MPTDSQPLVSIAMPVYNGDRSICQALDSLSAPDFHPWEKSALSHLQADISTSIDTWCFPNYDRIGLTLE